MTFDCEAGAPSGELNESTGIFILLAVDAWILLAVTCSLQYSIRIKLSAVVGVVYFRTVRAPSDSPR